MNELSYKMTRTPIDFSKIVIYKIVCNDLNILNVYVGSTTNMIKRKSCHKHSCNNPSYKEYNNKKYKIIRLNGGWDNWSMVLIENYPCNNKNEALCRERYWVEKLHASMNVQLPSRTGIEYRTDNRNAIRLRGKQYHELNKDKIHAKRNVKFICECGGHFSYGDRSKHFKTSKHQHYVNSTQEYEYQWVDATPCSEQE